MNKLMILIINKFNYSNKIQQKIRIYNKNFQIFLMNIII